MVDVPQVFAERRVTTDERVARVSQQLMELHADAGTVCVYATGSVARGEANAHSDLDIFILDAYDEQLGELPFPEVKATLLRADLIRAGESAGFPPFSGDGIYLETHTVSKLVVSMGGRKDDVTNAFTARMLLILESRAILNHAAHELAKNRIVDSYWRDFADHTTSFSPVFLVNDIMRYWKTVCVNYEADRTAGAPTGVDGLTWKNRSRLRNVKLKFSRLWEGYSRGGPEM